MDQENDLRCEKRRLFFTAGRTLIYLAVAYAVLMVGLMLFENFFIFFPLKYPNGDWEPVRIEIEDARFRADDGTKLHGWYVHHDDPRVVILFCHGNAGNITHRAETLRVLHDVVGASVMIFDYRGYGRSEGSPNERGILADGRAARTWLAKRAKVDESDIVILGRSLGGAVAVDLAAELPPRALVLESTFPSVPDMAAHHYSWFPVRFLLRTKLNSMSKISKYHGPLLQSHSVLDSIVPYEMGRRLFEAANEPKQFFKMADRDHNDPQPGAYYDAMVEFLDQQ